MGLIMTGTFYCIYRETSAIDMSRLTNRSVIEIFTIGHTANKAYVKVIDIGICIGSVNLYKYLLKNRSLKGPTRK